MTTFKRMYGEYIVTIDGKWYSFPSCQEAVEFIFRKEL